MADFDIESNANLVAADLVAVGVKAGAKAFGVTRQYGEILVTQIKRNASLPRTGPPGPRLQTGGYVRSWTVATTVGPTGPTATAGTSHPAGRRLEMGFTGVDSLGRRYDQPPYVHVGSAMDLVGPQFAGAIAAVAVDD